MKRFLKGLVGCLVLSLVFSCAKNKEASVFSMTIDAVIEKQDSIHVFYKQDGTINFSDREAFWVSVQGQKRNQEIVVEFPKGVVPNQIRIDFSNNISQLPIVFNKVEFNYLTNSFIAEGKEIYKYFRIDESNTVLNKQLGALTRKEPPQKAAPSLYPNGYYLAVKLEDLKYTK